MQSPRFNLDDVNDSIVIFFLPFSQMAEWKGGWRGRGHHKMSGLSRVTVKGKAQMMMAASSCSLAFAALHLIMGHVEGFF